MSKLLAALGLSTALAALSAPPLAGAAEAAMAYGGIGADTLHRIAPVEKAQVSCPFFSDGVCYCWYDDAWNGPGWYQCGYAWNNGFGWGGGWGWHHWHHGWGGPFYHQHGWGGWGHPGPHPFFKGGPGGKWKGN